MAPLVEQWLAETRASRASVALLDLVEEFGPSRERGADLSAYSGHRGRRVNPSPALTAHQVCFAWRTERTRD